MNLSVMHQCYQLEKIESVTFWTALVQLLLHRSVIWSLLNIQTTVQSQPSYPVMVQKAIFKIIKYMKVAKLIHLRAEHCQKYALTIKDSISYKKSQWAHMSISHQRGARGLQRLPFSKYEHVKWHNRFTVGLNATKNTHYTKKCFK